MQKYKSNITTTSGAAVRGVPVLVIKEDGSNAALFLDRAGTVPAPNPLTTGPDGVFYFYAVNGRYSLRTTVEGVTITDDDVVLMMDPEEITVAGPIAEAVAAAQAAAIAAEFSVEASGIPDLVAAAQNAVVDSNNAVTQATSAANNAALSKTGADSARDAAVIAKNAAETALDSFDDRYLGAKAVAPTTDNDGGALLTGALYWDTPLPGMRSWNGGAWVTLPAATAAAISYLPSGTGAMATTVQSKLRETVSVKDFGAVGDGVTDDTAAFNAAWAYIKASLDADTANLANVSRGITIPPGAYFINSSVNWTALRCWNIHVDMRGAKIVGGSGCAGRAIIDASDVRGLHLEGGYIESTQSVGAAPLCGLLLGPSGTLTCGNNSLRDVKIMGVFTLAPYINIGSETTYHYNCYFAQTSTDAATYAYVGDGVHSRAAVVSAYTTLRANNVAASFTNNKFYGCHFRNYGGGSVIYLSYTTGWEIDSGCYIMGFNKSNIELFQSGAFRNVDLTLGGLYETSLSTGVDYAVTFIVPDGQISGLVGFVFKSATPLASNAVFNVVNEAGGVTTGTLLLAQADIRVSGRKGSCLLFEPANCGALTINGELRYRASAGLNLYDLAKFNGIVYTTDGSAIKGGPGAKIFNYLLVDETTFNGQVFAVSKGPSSYLGVQNGVRPVLRAEGAATDIDLALQGKGTGLVRFGTRTASADVPVTGYIEIKDVDGTIRRLAVIG